MVGEGREVVWAGEVQKQYSRKGKLNGKIFKLRRKKNSEKEFDNEKKFLWLKNSPTPPPPITFLMVRP